ncbi:hypothetical protein GCM10009682_15100 [Luedemannella flava]|uniref:Uncharacterized protein n=1 Tax=Luedemannella flava TaxID=349316 RepID=A0ABN2LN67_9ACTN
MSAERIVGIDDLLSREEDDPTPRRKPERPARQFLIRTAITAPLIAAVLYAMLPLLQVKMAYPLLLAFTLAVLVIRRAVRLVVEPGRRLTRDLVAHRVVAYDPTRDDGVVGADGLSRAVLRWEMRLEWSGVERQRFMKRMPLLIGEIVDERLRQRHGLTLEHDRAAARRLCGPELWAFLTEPMTRIPTPRQFAVIVKQMEAL